MNPFRIDLDRCSFSSWLAFPWIFKVMSNDYNEIGLLVSLSTSTASDFPLWAQVKVIHWWGYYVWWNCSGCSCDFCNWGGIMSRYLYLQLMSIFLYGDFYFVTFLFVSLLLSQMPARVLSWFHLAGTFWVFYLIYLHPHFHKSISSASCSIIYWLNFVLLLDWSVILLFSGSFWVFYPYLLPTPFWQEYFECFM